MKKIIILFLLILLISEARANIAYQLKCPGNLLLESEEIMLGEVGTCEATGKNDGDVEKYLRSVGLQADNPYCAAGQYWCFRKACRTLGISYDYIPIPRTALVYNIFAHARAEGRKCSYRPKRHSLIIWQFPKKKRGHVERITKVGRAGNVETVGFNTSAEPDGNQRDGQGVYIRKRNVFHPLGRMRIKCLVHFSGGSDV